MASAARQNNPLIRYLTVQAKAEVELRQVLKQAAIQMAATVNADAKKGGSVDAARLTLLIQHIQSENRELWVSEIQPIIQKYYPLAEDAADKAAAFLDSVLSDAVGKDSAKAFLAGIKQQSIIARQLDIARRTRDLSPRVYKNIDLLNKRIDRTIRAHIIQGQVNAKQLAQSVKGFVDPSTPGGVSYAAKRLARTEINNAFHDRSTANAQNKPWVSAMKWNLSLSHHGQDDCNLLAVGHSLGQPEGEYLPTEIPEKPHPQCLCYTTYVTVSPAAMVNMLRADMGKKAI